MRFLRLVVFVAAASIGSQLPADPPHALRNPDALVLEGIGSIDHASVRNALHANFDLIVASRPNTPLAEYLKKLESVLAVGLEHSGCSSAKVAASYDTAREKIIVRVAEGPRHFCDDIKVTGAGDELIRAIVHSLTTADEPENILWRKGHAAAYDKLTKEEVQRHVAAVLADAGYFAADCHVSIDAAADPKSANLVVAIKDLGPHAVVGEISVTGANRDNPTEVLRYLGLRAGQPLDGNLPEQIHDRLLASGRYLTSEVSRTRNDQQSGNGHDVHDLKIDVCEFEFAPPLAERLSAEEQALLRVADWAARWQRNELAEDLVITATLNATPDELTEEPQNRASAIGRTKLRMVVAPRRGTTIAAQCTAANGRPLVDIVLASLPERLLLGSPSRKATLEVPHAGTIQLKVSAEFKGRDPELHDGRPFAMTCGVKLGQVNAGEGTPLQVEMKIQPASLLNMLQDEQIQCRLEGDLLEIRQPKFKATIEAATGKPVEIVWTDPETGSRLSIAAVPGALAAEQHQIDERLAGAKSTFDPASPWRSAACFVLDDVEIALDALGGAGDDANPWRQRRAACRALRKLLHAWIPPSLQDVAAKLKEDEDKDEHGFELPRSLAEFEFEDLLAEGDPARRRNLVGFLIGLLHHAAPKDGWLQPVCRDVLLSYGDGSLQPGCDLLQHAQSPATGPLGESIFARFATTGAAQAGLNRLSVSGFRSDYQPLLAGDSWLSKLILSLAEAARTLDEDELRAVAGLVDDAYTCEMLTTLLVSLKAQSDRPVADALAAALDEVWKQGLSDYLKVLLEAQVAAEKARLSQVLYPKTKTPKITPIEQPTPLSDQLKRLEALEEELKAARGNQAETPLTDALKRLEDQKKR